MAHFAELDENNIVKQVIVVHNNELKGANGVEYENKGVEFCNGFTYDDVNDVFVAPQPFPSWSLDENHDWQPPTPMPEDASEEKPYIWNEESQTWDLITE